MSNADQQQYDAQVAILQERFPQQPAAKLLRLLQRHDGDVDQVRARLSERELGTRKWDLLETRFGAAVTALQQELPSTQSMRRFRLLKIMERFGGDLEQSRQFLQTRDARQEELKMKYAGQLAELASAGIDVQKPCPCIFRQLEKNQGDVTPVLEKMKNRSERKSKYAKELGQLEADGVQMKNRRRLVRFLEKANGDVNVAKQLIAQRQEKHRQRKGPSLTTEDGEASTNSGKSHGLSIDDLQDLKLLRNAGLHGNPKRMLATFHECNKSIELTIARTEEAREKRCRERGERTCKRTQLATVHDAYMQLDEEHVWPEEIEQVYLDGNNMMFVVDCLRRLCLNRAGKKTERAIGQIAAAWSERLHIPRVDLIFDSTRQVDQIGGVIVSSAHPRYPTTDDMLVEIARRPENQEKNKRTVVVTSDRGLAALLLNEGCRLLKPSKWFAHCVRILTPDLIQHEEVTGTSTPATLKVRYNFDELVHRIAKIDL